MSNPGGLKYKKVKTPACLTFVPTHRFVPVHVACVCSAASCQTQPVGAAAEKLKRKHLNSRRSVKSSGAGLAGYAPVPGRQTKKPPSFCSDGCVFREKAPHLQANHGAAGVVSLPFIPPSHQLYFLMQPHGCSECSFLELLHAGTCASQPLWICGAIKTAGC